MEGAISYQREQLSGLWDQILPLTERHWEEIAHYQDIPLEVDQDRYGKLEAGGAIRCYTVRTIPWQLIGYVVYIFGTNGHYKGSLQANQDVLFLLPEFRRGRVGSGLIRFSEARLREEGCQVIYQHAKTRHPLLGELLTHHMGYDLVDQIYAKRLDR